MKELSVFALKRHGYGDTNGGFGVIYPEDLDEYDREVDKTKIPEGCLEIYGFWGGPEGFEMVVTEVEYLDELADRLESEGFLEEFNQVRKLRTKIPEQTP